MPENDVDMVRATFILMVTILASIIIVVIIGPVVDILDYQITITDLRSLPTAGNTMHSLHNYFYTVIAAINIIVGIWYIKLVFSVHTYTKQYG
jgi:hypothetical protein